MLSQLPQMPVYPLWPFTIESAKGSWIITDKGEKFLDMYGGHAVASVGHCHAKLTEAISSQAAKLMFYSNVCDLKIRNQFCNKLMSHMPKSMQAVFLCNSGAEANENALTLARLKTGRRNIISVQGGFHGRTALCLSICGIEKYRKLSAQNGKPVFDDVAFLDFNDLASIDNMVDQNSAAVILEPVQGLAGARAFTKEFLLHLKQRCEETGTMLIFDEVQCGSGRTGTYTAAEHCGVSPNIITMAKGLAGGFPVGATVADNSFDDILKAGTLGTTFGGGPLACAAGLATLNIIEEENLLDNVREISRHIFDKLSECKGIKNISGKGFLIGITTDIPSSQLIKDLREKHNIIAGSSTDPNTMRIMPPLTLQKKEAEIFTNAVRSILS